MTPVAIGDIQRTQGTLKTVYKAKNRYRHLYCVYIHNLKILKNCVYITICEHSSNIFLICDTLFEQIAQLIVGIAQMWQMTADVRAGPGGWVPAAPVSSLLMPLMSKQYTCNCLNNTRPDIFLLRLFKLVLSSSLKSLLAIIVKYGVQSS